MSVDDEILTLRQIVEFVDGEQLLGVIPGSVTMKPGDDFVSRSGILFITNMRVGVSAKGSWITVDDARWLGYPSLRGAVTWKTRLTVLGVENVTFLVEINELDLDFREHCGDLGRARAIIVGGMNSLLRSDLVDDYEVAAGLAAGESADEALAILEALQAKCPDSLPVARQRISILWRQNRKREALEVARRAVTLPAFVAEQNDWLVFRSELACDVGETEEAIDAATQLIERDVLLDGYLLRARARYAASDSQSAQLDLEKAALVDPTDPRPWELLAEIALGYDDASMLQRCRSKFSELGQERSARIYAPAVHQARRAFGEAYRLAQEALSEGLDHPIVARTLLMAATDLEDPSPLAQLEQLDAIGGDDVMYQLCAATLLLQHERFDDARARLEGVPFPESPTFIAIKSLFEASQKIGRGDWPGAYQQLDSVVIEEAPSWLVSESDQELWTACCTLAGWALVELGDPDAALSYLRRAEAGARSGLPWIRAALPELLERATARASVLGSDTTSRSKLPTYEVLRKLNEGVRRSQRLGALAPRVQRMLDDFDEAPLLAVMGEYSVGKSSFINALVQRPLLPTGEGVTTGTVTVLRHGVPERMRAVFADGRVAERQGLTAIDDFVKETGRGTSVGDLPHHVDIFLDSPVLKTTTVVDTPGLNAPFPEHQRITESYLSESDAIVWVFNAETAGRSTEKQFIDRLGEHRRKTVGVVNQIDLVPKDELKDVMDGVREAFPSAFMSIHPVSAKRALAGLLKEDLDLVKRSGLPSLVVWLEENVLNEARPIKESATREKIRSVLDEVRTSRISFDDAVQQQLESVRTSRNELINWVDHELADSVAEALEVMKDGAEGSIKDLVAALFTNQEKGILTVGDVSEQGRALVASSREHWSTGVNAVLSRYDSRMLLVEPTLEGLSSAEWQGVLNATRRALRLSFASWRKDLLDYAEHLDAYINGFTDADGLLGAYRRLPDGSHESPEAMRVGLRPALSFLWERPRVAMSRWTVELRSNIGEELGKIEREMRGEAARVRTESFRGVEALGGLL